MEKIIRIGGYEIPVKSTAASLFAYKANFGRDGLQDIMAFKDLPLSYSEDGAAAGVSDLSGIDYDVIYRFLWVFARAKNPGIKPLEEWLEDFDVPAITFIVEAAPQVTDLLTAALETRQQPKNAGAAATRKRK